MGNQVSRDRCGSVGDPLPATEGGGGDGPGASPPPDRVRLARLGLFACPPSLARLGRRLPLADIVAMDAVEGRAQVLRARASRFAS
tara:strand:+ start:3994 stop:4251 length:258 start_codon:yes stop_codon:yes gene_type:complete